VIRSQLPKSSGFVPILPLKSERPSWPKPLGRLVLHSADGTCWLGCWKRLFRLKGRCSTT
jgi:hypothetical protein